VGTGDGALVLALRRLGFHAAVGVEPNIERDVVDGGALVVQRGRIEDVAGPFEIVMLHHSFEHMDRPLAALREVRRLLVAGGTCVLRIPVFPSWAWERYGTAWVQLDAPRHLFLHSVGSVRRLAAEAGLTVRDVVHDSGPLQFWGSERYEEGLPLFVPGAPRRARVRDFLRRHRLGREAARLNAEGRGDQATFYLAPGQA
jgi:SAM-dependent methyltransferase